MIFFELVLMGLAIVAMFYFSRHWFLLSKSTGPFVPIKSTKITWGLAFNIGLTPSLSAAALLLIAILVYATVELLFPSHWKIAISASCMAIVVALYIFSEVSSWQLRRFESKFITSLDLMATAVQGGLPPRQAILAAAQASQGAVQRELKEIDLRLSLGANIERALERLLVRYNCESTRLFSQALIARYQSGTNFSAVLQSISTLLHDRIDRRTTLEAQLSATRYAAMFAAALPYILIPLLLWQRPEWFEPLQNHPRGPAVFAGALISQVIGFFWLQKTVRVKL